MRNHARSPRLLTLHHVTRFDVHNLGYLRPSATLLWHLIRVRPIRHTACSPSILESIDDVSVR